MNEQCHSKMYMYMHCMCAHGNMQCRCISFFLLQIDIRVCTCVSGPLHEQNVPMQKMHMSKCKYSVALLQVRVSKAVFCRNRDQRDAFAHPPAHEFLAWFAKVQPCCVPTLGPATDDGALSWTWNPKRLLLLLGAGVFWF